MFPRKDSLNEINVGKWRVSLSNKGCDVCTEIERHFWFLVLIGPVWEGGQKDEDKRLHDAMFNSLSECHKRKLASIAVSAISSGIFGFPKRRCAKILFSTVLQFFRAEPASSVDLVRFTNFDKETVEVFLEAADNLKNEPGIRVEILTPTT